MRPATPREWSQLIGALKPSPDQLIFHARTEGLLMIARLGEGSPVVSGGYGGWEDVARPGRAAATRFSGSSTVRQLQIPIVLGSWPRQYDIMGGLFDCEGSIRILESMARQAPGDDRGEHPPIVRVKGAVPYGNLPWVVDDVQWGEAIVLPETRTRVQALATVVLRHYVAPRVIVVRPRPVARRRDRQPAIRRIKVKRGDTLDSIVKREMGADTREEKLAAKRLLKRLNRVSDPKVLLKRREIRVPRRKQKKR
jgi:hypothetical protein